MRMYAGLTACQRVASLSKEWNLQGNRLASKGYTTFFYTVRSNASNMKIGLKVQIFDIIS